MSCTCWLFSNVKTIIITSTRLRFTSETLPSNYFLTLVSPYWMINGKFNYRYVLTFQTMNASDHVSLDW